MSNAKISFGLVMREVIVLCSIGRPIAYRGGHASRHSQSSGSVAPPFQTTRSGAEMTASESTHAKQKSVLLTCLPTRWELRQRCWARSGTTSFLARRYNHDPVGPRHLLSLAARWSKREVTDPPGRPIYLNGREVADIAAALQMSASGGVPPAAVIELIAAFNA
jgi:hypothetical protein